MARWAHFSDIHAFCAPRRGQWNAKRLLGAANWTLFRGRKHGLDRLAAVVAAVAADPPDFCLLTGDAAQLGLTREFDRCIEIFAPLTRLEVPILCVDGNHDHYGSVDGGKAWRAFAETLRLGVEPDHLGVARIAGGEILLLNQARVNWVHRSGGELAEGYAARLAREWRRPLDAEDATAVENEALPEPWRIAAGHYPARTPHGRVPHALHGLRGAADFPALLEACGVSAYFCGHYHHAYTFPLFDGCTQYCAGSTTLTAQASRYAVRDGEIVPDGAYAADA